MRLNFGNKQPILTKKVGRKEKKMSQPSDPQTPKKGCLLMWCVVKLLLCLLSPAV